jgi:tRNA nucleotidyltransferase (CCA-adding enzyme)
MGRGKQDSYLINNTDASFSLRKEKEEQWLTKARQGVGSTGLNTYEVGGSLRDEQLNKPTKDLDVCVVGSEKDLLLNKLNEFGPADILSVADQTIGARSYADFAPKGGIEFALARREVSTGNGHKDFKIVPAPDVTLEEDLARRDFTCNALARKINPDGSTGQLIDPYNGVQDLKDGLLRPVGPTTIAEDPLRVLRGLARISKDNLRPTPETVAAMKAEISKLGPDGPLSSDRIYEEMNKVLSGDHAAEALRFARDNGIYQAIFPELKDTVGFNQKSKYHSLNVDEHCLTVLQRACENNAPLAVRWAALLHDSGKPAMAWEGKDGYYHFYRNPKDPDSVAHEYVGAEIASKVLDRLNASNEVKEKVNVLINNHMYNIDQGMEARKPGKNEFNARKLIKRVGREHIDDLLLLRRCDHAGKSHQLEADFYQSFEPFERLIAEQKDAPLNVKELAIGGKELMDLGLKGPAIGEAQRELLKRVIQDPNDNNNQRLIAWARKIAQKQ